MANSDLRRTISRLRRSITNCGSISSLSLALLEIRETRCANLQVDIDS